MESDQHVVKAAFLVEIEAVGSCCIFLGTWMLYPEPDTAVIETTWVLLWILEHGNLSGWRVVASGWKLVVSGIWRWSPWNLGLVENVSGLLQGVTAAYCTLDLFFTWEASTT